MQVVAEHQVVGHRQPVRLHRVVVAVVARPHVRVIEVRDAVLRRRHRSLARKRGGWPADSTATRGVLLGRGVNESSGVRRGV
jgi:hypothetical protein